MKVAPDTTPVNGVASWAVTNLAPGSHALSVQGWDSPSGTPGNHSGVWTTTVVVPPPPVPPPPPVLPPPPPPSYPPAPPSSGSSPGLPTPPHVPATLPAQIKPSAAQIARRLYSQLVVSGNASKIAAVLKHDGYTLSFNALTAGRVVIAWYDAKGAEVAIGKARFSTAGSVKVTIKLTAHGKRMLKAHKRLKLTAKDTYTPTGESAVSATRAFTLRR